MKAFAKNRSGLIGAVITTLIVGTCLLGPSIYVNDPLRQNLESTLTPPGRVSPLGTDMLGRDLLSRILLGGRVSITVSLLALIIAAIPGTLLGLLAGYVGHMLDLVISRLADILMTIPTILLAIGIVGVFGPGIRNLILAMGIVGIPRFVRVVRAEVVRNVRLDYVTSARSIGASDVHIMWNHVLRNCHATIIVISSYVFAANILTEAALSFLGVGVVPPSPSWGSMIAQGQAYLVIAPWLSIFPGGVIASIVVGVNMFGDGLRDVLDPRLRGKGYI